MELLENGAIASVTKLNFFQMYLSHNKVKFFPQILTDAKAVTFA